MAEELRAFGLAMAERFFLGGPMAINFLLNFGAGTVDVEAGREEEAGVALDFFGLDGGGRGTGIEEECLVKYLLCLVRFGGEGVGSLDDTSM